MANWDRLKKDNDRISESIISDCLDLQYDFQKVILEAKKTAEIAESADSIIDSIDADFEKAAKLKGIDVKFLLLATALQCVRQYVIGTITQRTDHKTAAEKVKGNVEEHSNRVHRYYNPSLEEIISNPVPFDANFGANGALAGGGKLKHRVTAIGHDPILGLIFGTSNIATSTLTNNRFMSYHITTRNKRDYFKNKARTSLVLEYTADKLMNQGIKGKVIVGTSLIKEIVHLKTDIYSTDGLPLPLISIKDPKMASSLASYGFDMGNVVKTGKQATYAVLINSLIGMIHGLFYDESVEYSWDVYSVRTRKILSYSNLIASASNVIAVAIAAGIGVATENPDLVKKSVNYLDIAGIMVTIYRIVTDRKFIYEVKREFLQNEWENLVLS